MPIAPEHAFKEKSIKLLILPSLRTIYNRTFQCETPCIVVFNNGKGKESNCGFRKVLASLWLSSAHPNFVKRREKLFPVIEFHFYRNIYALFLKKMGWLWECLEMIFRMFPVYTQKTVPQRYLFFSICIGTTMYPSCQIMLRRLFNWYVTFFRKNILSFCIFPIGFHIFVKLHSSVFRNLLPTILQDIYLSYF